MKTFLSFAVQLFALLVFAAPSGLAQIFFSSGSPYVQNFDSLANTGGGNTWADNSTLPGWYASKTLGGSAVSTLQVGTGSSTTGGLYSFGSAGSTERALGSLASGTPGNFAYGVRFINDTANVITNLILSYTGEQWRGGGNTAAQSLSFSYQISNVPILTSDAANATQWTPFPALNFTSPFTSVTAGAQDGNAAANQQSFPNVLLPDVVVFPGQEIFFRWFDLNDAGNDHGLAIDNLAISFTTIAPFTNPPAISDEPQSSSCSAGVTANFTVTATGSSLNYQWRKAGVDLSDDGLKIFGALTSTLTISNVLAADAGEYSVVITNSVDSITSAAAVLTVIDPAINVRPMNRTAVAGDNANFSIVAAGTPPLTYQWQFNGVDLTDATTSSLSIPNVQPGNQGHYTVTVANGLGSSTNALAMLTVLPTANLLVEWDFNDTNSLAAEAPIASIGSGTATLLNTKASFAAGSGSDRAGSPGPANSGWNTSGYAGQSTSNKLSGVQFNASTRGFQDLFLTWEERHSNTASKYLRLQYSADGVNFVDGPVVTMPATNNSFVFYSASLANIPALNDNPNFAFRLVSEFESTAIGSTNNNYSATATSYGTSGTIRFDLVRAFANPTGTVSPIPLYVQQLGSDLVLTWSNPAFSLALAPHPDGPFTKIIGATSPYTNTPSGTATFFRLVYP
jgi:hypothetical protein